MDQQKVQAVINWPVLASHKDVQRFLGFAKFYQKFNRNFSSVAAPLHALTTSKMQFLWSPQVEETFQHLKKCFVSAPFLSLPERTNPFAVEVNASDSGRGALLSQHSGKDNKIHPCAYLSRQLPSAERNCSIEARELLAGKAALED